MLCRVGFHSRVKKALWEFGVRDIEQCLDLEEADAEELGINKLQLRTLKRKADVASRGRAMNIGNVQSGAASQLPFSPTLDLMPQGVALTGEEGEQELLVVRGTLFVMQNESWERRGTGQMKLLCNVVTHTRRLLMRSEVNSRILCNCTVEPRIQMSVISSNPKQQCWIAYDYCETKSGTYECMQRTFGFKVATIEEAECFKTYFEEAIKDTARLLEYPVEEQSVVAEDEQTSSASQVMANSFFR